MGRGRLRLSIALACAMLAGLMGLRPAGAVGTLAPAVSYNVFGQAVGLVAADFNGDSIPDLATTTPSGVGVLIGTGGGSFYVQTSNAMFSGSPTWIASGQLNGGGGLDLALSTTNGLLILSGNGNGSFTQSSMFLAGTNATGVAVGDINGDFRDDVVVCSGLSGNVTTFINNGMGLSMGPTFLVGSFPQNIILARVNGDAFPDIVTANAMSTISVLMNNGAGSFGSPTNTNVPNAAYGVAAGNFNGDPFTDLAVASYGMMGGGVTVLIGNGTPNFGSLGTFAAGSQPRALALGDINADSRTDVVAANYGSNNISVMLGTGTGSLGTPTNYAVGANPDAVVAQDFNGGGAIDVATANLSTNNVSVLLNASLPSAPLNLNAAAGPGNGEISLSWQPPADDGGSQVLYYSLYRGLTSGGESFLTNVFGTSYLDSGLPAGTTFYYQVAAVNVVGESLLSNEAFATTFGPPTPPQNVTAAPGTSVGEVRLTWSAPVSDGGSPITSWIVCRGTSPGVEPFCGNLPANASSYSDGGNLPLTSYYYVLYAVNGIGQSPASAETCAKPFPWASALGC